LKTLIAGATIVASLLFTSPTIAATIIEGEDVSTILQEQETLQNSAETTSQIFNADPILVDTSIPTNQPSNLTEPNIEEKHTESLILSDYEIDLLARLVRAEAQTEPLEGKIAVACVVLNRVESSQFPNSIEGVIYQSGQFQPVSNGAINKPADAESFQAVNAALSESRQIVQGSLFFYNPVIATDRWLDSRKTTLVIGNHVFKE
jgi:N-acetylmuramoyl-L-alanine amidase